MTNIIYVGTDFYIRNVNVRVTENASKLNNAETNIEKALVF